MVEILQNLFLVLHTELVVTVSMCLAETSRAVLAEPILEVAVQHITALAVLVSVQLDTQKLLP
jgi:hypothetical protein